MLELTVTIKGKTSGDLETALEETLRKVRDGNTEGQDRNDSGRYFFSVKGEEEGEFADESRVRVTRPVIDDGNAERRVEVGVLGTVHRFLDGTYDVKFDEGPDSVWFLSQSEAEESLELVAA